MRQSYKLLFGIFFLFAQLCAMAQTEEVFSIEDGDMILHLKRKLSKNQCDSICRNYALPAFSIDSIFNYNQLGSLEKEGWKIKSSDADNVYLKRALSEMTNSVDWSKNAILLSSIYRYNRSVAGGPGYPKEVAYGRNKFKQKVTVRQRIAGKAIFWLPDFKNAKKVYLSGNFNDWSLYGTPLNLTDSGWVVQINLEPGKYFYKFIVDGKWIEDSYNDLKEEDGHDGYNSTYFQTNYTFRLSGFSTAQRVVVCGSFNNWNENELQLFKDNQGWFANIYLQDGVHTYKFIVDGKWITDPRNKWMREDGEGHFNSVIGRGDTITFKLKGFENAQQVVLSGNFINWRTNELKMEKGTSGWKLTYMLPPGNYEYKFIVDGNWMVDPSNAFTSGEGDTKNSVLCIKPNHIFKLKKYPEAKSVYVLGSFNDWAEPGYKMYQRNGEWVFPIHLKPGKYTYKFVVNKRWILDPDNKMWEENEFNTNNSVLWIESK